MNTKWLSLNAALIVCAGFFNSSGPVLPNVQLEPKASQSLEYFSALEQGDPLPENGYFVKTIFSTFPDEPSACRSHPVVHPISLERMAQ
ncbi:MAG TPA: hypothetical protein VLX68_06200 [Chitinivibrionales bacterium]|nr:hypothetical protein [Chitinivibrionales bacterium]